MGLHLYINGMNHIQNLAQDLEPGEIEGLTAACELALQRMQLYNEDAAEANTLTRQTRSGAKDRSE